MRTPEALLQEWKSALLLGLSASLGDSLTARIAASLDYRLVYYGDLFAGVVPPSCGDRVERIPAADVMVNNRASLSGVDLSSELLENVARRNGNAWMHRLVLEQLPDVRLFLQNPTIHCAVVKRMQNVLDALGSAPTVVVAHSMGSLVTYAALNCSDRVRAVVTLGAPLFHERYFATLSELAPKLGDKCNSGSALAQRSRRWINLKGQNDYVGSYAYNTGAVARSIQADFVEGTIRTFPFSKHDIRGYLANPLVAQSILRLMCSTDGANLGVSCGDPVLISSQREQPCLARQWSTDSSTASKWFRPCGSGEALPEGLIALHLVSEVGANLELDPRVSLGLDYYCRWPSWCRLLKLSGRATYSFAPRSDLKTRPGWQARIGVSPLPLQPHFFYEATGSASAERTYGLGVYALGSGALGRRGTSVRLEAGRTTGNGQKREEYRIYLEQALTGFGRSDSR